MIYSSQMARTLIVLVTVLFLMPVHSSQGADRAQRRETSEWATKRAERERRFLYRAVEELNKSQEYVNDTIRGLEKQIDAVELLEPSRRERDLRIFLDWYQSYADWLRNNADDFEADLSRAYSEEPARRTAPDRYDGMANGYTRLGSQLGEHVARLEKANDRIGQRMDGLKRALEYIDSAAYREGKNRDKMQRQPERDRHDDDLYARYKDLSDAEIIQMQQELRTLGDLQKHFVVLLELSRLELGWLDLKADDNAALSYVARVIGGDAPAPVEDACSLTIKTYESDVAYLRRKIDDVDRMRASISRAVGTLKTLDRIEELSVHYESMKSRYEHHINWLTEQIGAYRADLTELWKEK